MEKENKSEILRNFSSSKLVGKLKNALETNDSEKENRTDGSHKPSAAKSVFDKIKKSPKAKESRIPNSLKGHVDFDLKNKRVFLSHEFISKAVNYALSFNENIEVKEFFPVQDGGYFCKAVFENRIVSLRFIVTQIIYEQKLATVVIQTPDGIRIEDHFFLNLIANTFLGLFGGTEFGGWVLSKKSPLNVQWDGKSAQCTFDVPAEHVPKWMQSASVVLTISQESRGLWVTFDGYETFCYWVGKIIDWLVKIFLRRI